MQQLTGHRALRQVDTDLARMGGTPVSKSAKARAVVLAQERVYEEIATFCDTGKEVSDLREQRLRHRERKRLLAEAKRTLWRASEERQRENYR
jgi:hypothetical protein